MEHLQGRTEIVHEHFKELFNDTSHADIPESIEQRWPWETLESLPLIDGERVREIAWAFRNRTWCVEDQIVIEMLRELDSDIWSTLVSCFQHRLLNHWTEATDKLSNMQLVTMVKEKKRKQQLTGQAPQSRRSPQFGHVPVAKPMKWCGCSDEWRSRPQSDKFRYS